MYGSQFEIAYQYPDENSKFVLPPIEFSSWRVILFEPAWGGHILGIDIIVDLKGIDGSDLADFEFLDSILFFGMGEEGLVIDFLDLVDEVVEELAAGVLCHLIEIAH